MDKNKIGTEIGIRDKNNNPIKVGDIIQWNGYKGIVLWHKKYEEYWFFISYSRWYGDDIFDGNSYGKGFKLPMDNGARMEMEIIIEGDLINEKE